MYINKKIILKCPAAATTVAMRRVLQYIYIFNIFIGTVGIHIHTYLPETVIIYTNVYINNII